MTLACGFKHRPGRGFSLVEVLVTLVILSIGLLSLAALQLATLKNNGSALTRFEATTLIDDILDRMRANRMAAIQGDYDIDLDDDVPAGSDLLHQDLYAWRCALAEHLPDGKGSISVSGHQARITLQWSESWDAQLSPDPGERHQSLIFMTEL